MTEPLRARAAPGANLGLPHHDAGLSDEQNVAFDMAIRFVEDPAGGNTLFVAGQAGAGKTHLLNKLAQRYRGATLLAPMGKTAANLSARTGMSAMTIHSFLYRLQEIRKTTAGRPDMLWERKHAAGAFSGYLVLLDEAPMAGAQVVRDLLLSGVRIVAVGDPNQLKPVGQEPYFTAPDYTLTQPHRTALDSPIIRQAHRILRSQPYAADGEPFQVLRQAYDATILDADIIVTWTHKQRLAHNARTRALRDIRSATPVIGEPIVCGKNHAGLYRGAIYTLVEPFNEGDTAITLSVDDRVRRIDGVTFAGIDNALPPDAVKTWFDYGYAITVHSSAGSEWPRVLVINTYPRHEIDYGRWIYTAVTRASERVTVVSGR